MYQKKAWIFARIAAALVLLILFNTNSSARAIGIKQPLKIVQLGDSYSAGNGARSTSGERNYVSVPGCNRSPTNWGSQYVASLQGTYSVTYINRACSSGVTDDITNRRKMGDEFKESGKCPTPKYPDEEYYEDTSLFKCTRYIKPQYDAIDSSVDLVLMTLGGNNLKFSTIVQDCFSILRSPNGCREDVKYAKGELDKGNLQASLLDTFAHIKAKLRPGARIVYVSYPYLSLNVPYTVDFYDITTGILLDSYDAGKEIRELSGKGDEAQRAAVSAANAAAGEDYIIFYDGTKRLFTGREPNPSLIAENPNRWINEFEGSLLSSLDKSEMYHPNPLGHANWGKALSSFGSFGVVGGTSSHHTDIDVAFVVDTTGSMGDDIAQVQADLSSLVDQLAETTDSYRVAVVSYRDFPERTGSSGDYPSKVINTFTEDPVLIQSAIDSLTLGYGGDGPETVFSGIQAAIGLPWRPGVTKIAIVIGDAPALSPEPISNLTADQIVANSMAIDPVQVMGVNTGSLDDNGALGQIANGTGGAIIQGTTELTTKISEILDQAAKQPFAWLGTAYSGEIGQPIFFDASGSYDPSGSPITLYEWDFNGDGVYDLQTEAASVTHVYDAAYDGLVVLRVTSQGGSALASVRTVVNAEGYVLQGDEEPCALDENGYSITIDQDGRFIPCIADHLPANGRDGVSETTGYRFYFPVIGR